MTRLGNLLDFGLLLKPLATIKLPKSPTFLGNFCKGVKFYHFSTEIIFRQLLQTIIDFFWSHWAQRKLLTFLFGSRFSPHEARIVEPVQHLIGWLKILDGYQEVLVILEYGGSIPLMPGTKYFSIIIESINQFLSIFSFDRPIKAYISITV